ncbi:MAG: uroporphyrinogen decarboxylase [Bacteroidaceae bacterium]|nr:uroporphyrinogen decarboxylase [Bacteroidaceae bacterium]
MQNNPFLAVVNNQNAQRPPVWMMRQAGRVLPRYRNITRTTPFRSIMANPKLAAEVTLMPIEDMGMDAAILFSDILVVPEALGVKVEWTSEGPTFPCPLIEKSVPADSLHFDVNRLAHVADTLDEIGRQKSADTPVIGFCGGVLTCLCYMLGGRDRSMQFTDVVRYLYTNREEAKQMLEILTRATEEYVHLQAAHGIDAFQIFESFAGTISVDLYLSLIMPYIRRITAAARSHGLPVIFFPKGFGVGINSITREDCDFVSVDWHTPLESARRIIAPELGIQGNMDPRLLFASQKDIEQQLNAYIPFFKQNPKWIFNLGHGLHKDTPIENVRFVTDWIRNADWK